MEPQGRDSHVEYANGAKSTRVPLSHVALHGRLHGIRELPDDRNSPCRAGEMFLLVPVHGLLEDEKGGHESEGGEEPGGLAGGEEEKRRDRGVQRKGGGGRSGHGRRVMAEEGCHGESFTR